MVDSDLFVHTDSDDPSAASVTVDAGDRADHTVEPFLYGKFSEHLGNNIYHGMEAEILFNPVFGEWHFRASNRRQSGGLVSENDPDRIDEIVREHGRPLAYPEETDPEALLSAYRDGMAFGWQPIGNVTASPDTGPNGNRAQRIELPSSGDGVLQETRLPLHRTSGYEFRTRLRAADPTTVSIGVRSNGDVLAEETVEVTEDWEIYESEFDLPADVDPDGVYDVVITVDEPANLVVERLLLYPDDHVNYADPDVIEFLRESDLPLLRWPGGNFVSGYDWTDGIGPIDDRPVKINPAWGGLEPNLFGTAEFVEFCEAVGCEPSLCVNAGNGTPEEAAKWVEYCNGDPEETEMGALRAEHGYEEPFDIEYWEVGNELWGPWQVRWTTPHGNADRYERFREAMLDVDPDLKLTATGIVTNTDRPWNETLLEECGTDVRAISSHPLAGGQVDQYTDPDELYHAFMGYSEQLIGQYADLEEKMLDAGIENPHLDVTELQLFASFQEGAEGMGREGGTSEQDADATLTPETMPTPETISEPLYNACIRHELIRMGEFPEMLTHSATVNHGGGLWKEGERVWANPCHYGRSMGTAQAGDTPVAVSVESDTISTETTFREIDPVDEVPAIDVMATCDDEDDELTTVVVNRTSRDESIDVSMALEGFDAAGEATLTTLGGETMHERNTREEPRRIEPREHTVAVEDEQLDFELPPYTMVRVTVPSA